MHFVVVAVVMAAVAMGSAAVALLMAWPLALGLTWLTHLDLAVSFALALGALVAVAFFIGVPHTAALPWRPREAAGEDEETDEDDEDDGFVEVKPVNPWFVLCPCGSGRSFARCCGKQAFRKQRH